MRHQREGNQELMSIASKWKDWKKLLGVTHCISLFFSSQLCLCKLNRNFSSSWVISHHFCHVWDHFYLHRTSSLLPSGFRAGGCHICTRPVLTNSSHPLHTVQRKKKNMFFMFACLVGFFNSKSQAETLCFSNCSIFRLSKLNEPLNLVAYWKSCSHLQTKLTLFLILSLSTLLFPVLVHFGQYFHRDFPEKRIQSDIEVHLNNIQE